MAERDRRWNLARSFMDHHDLDALLVFGEHEDAGAAPVNFDTWFTNGRPGTTVAFLKTGQPITHFPMALFAMDHLESSRRGDTMWIPPKDTRNSQDSSAVANTLVELGLTEATIGVVGLEPYPPWHPEGSVAYPLWHNILKLLPKARFKPVEHAFAQLIMPQSPEELAVVRHSANIGDAMVRAMVTTAAAGVPESEVYAAGMAAGYSLGAMPPAMHLWSGRDPVATGLPPWAYRPQKPRTLQEGDVITAELFCNFGGRHTQHQVLIAVGEVHPDYERAAEVVRAIYDAGLRALRPGRKFGDFAEEMLEPTRQGAAAGGWIMGPAVHGLNPLIALCGFPQDLSRLAGAEAYALGESSYATILGEMELKPGMTFAFEPNYGFGRHVVHLGGTVIVGEEGEGAIELNPSTARMLRAEGKPRG
ncbi:MAG: hypothetical protein Q9202_002332 [Teloschistes flavicans]